jgi:hypothetical protein
MTVRERDVIESNEGHVVSWLPGEVACQLDHSDDNP